ncbi:COBRA-like protein 10 [Linum perenne]
MEEVPSKSILKLLFIISTALLLIQISHAQLFDAGDDAGGGGAGGGGGDDAAGGGGGDGAGGGDDQKIAPPPGLATCNGIFLSYAFTSREREFPHVKNVTAQAWAFKSTASIYNTGEDELKAWQMFIGFHNREILVSADGGALVDGDELPIAIGKGATFVGTTMPDLKSSIETAGDLTQISAQIVISGTQFGLNAKAIPMPKNIKIMNDGFKCPAPKRKGKNYMEVCCRVDPKAKTKKKPKEKKTKFFPKRKGDLDITYDILQAWGNNYQAQITLDNINPLGRLDNWNLTWQWMHNEFIYNMRGAYTRSRNLAQCIYGPIGKYYTDFDFSTVSSCDRNPIISDLPPDRKDDPKIGKLPFCCKNGTLLPTIMNKELARGVFQMQVYKLPPNLNRTAFDPPQKWKIRGVLNSQYTCSPPVRIDPTIFPDITGLASTFTSIATWQIVCNITRPKERQTGCCVSFSAYYNDSAIPCNTCACGCDEDTGCNQKGNPMLLPPDALLVPFKDRTKKAIAWARLKHRKVPSPRPCPDNCPVSINWHVNSDFASGWTARMTLFNWDQTTFQDWFAAVQMGKAFDGYENVYSFNGTRLPKHNRTIFLQGLPGLNYLVAETNGSRPWSPRVPGKQQSVISFTKKQTPKINIARGDGFPKKLIFNGEECALPKHFPIKSGGQKLVRVNMMTIVVAAVVTFGLLLNR